MAGAAPAQWCPLDAGTLVAGHGGTPLRSWACVIEHVKTSCACFSLMPCCGQVYRIHTYMGAFDAPTKKASRFWSNHSTWMWPLIKELCPEDIQRIEDSGVKLAKRKRDSCYRWICRVLLLVCLSVHGGGACFVDASPRCFCPSAQDQETGKWQVNGNAPALRDSQILDCMPAAADAATAAVDTEAT